MIDYKPIFRSPITFPASGGPAELTISDLTGAPVVFIQGAAAGDLLKKKLSNIPANPGDAVDVGDGVLARLTPKELYLFGLSVEAALPSLAELEESLAGKSAHVTDFTHRATLLKLSGPASAELLSKICGLDFHESQFPTMQVKQSSAAKIKTLIARRDEGDTLTYHLHVNRPFGQYFMEIVWDAGLEFGIGVG